MGFSNLSQLQVFGYAFLLGLACGALYELFRFPRLLWKTHPILLFVQDTVYFFLVAVISFVYVFVANSGQLRAFVLCPIAIGAWFFWLTVGKATEFLAKQMKKKFQKKG